MVYTMTYYSAIKGTDHGHAAAWMNLKNVTLSEKSQTQKSTYGLIPLIGNVKKQTHKYLKWLPGPADENG